MRSSRQAEGGTDCGSQEDRRLDTHCRDHYKTADKGAGYCPCGVKEVDITDLLADAVESPGVYAAHCGKDSPHAESGYNHDGSAE